MKSFIKIILPIELVRHFEIYCIIKKWGKKNFLEHSPQLIKEFVFEKYEVVNAPLGNKNYQTFCGT